MGASGFSQILHTKPRWIFLSSKPEIKQSITQQQRELSDKHLQFSSIFNRKTQQDCAFFFQLSETFPRNNFETKTNRGARPRTFFYSQRKTAFNSVAQDFVFNLNSSATVCDIHRYFFVFVNNRRRGDRVF